MVLRVCHGCAAVGVIRYYVRMPSMGRSYDGRRDETGGGALESGCDLWI